MAAMSRGTQEKPASKSRTPKRAPKRVKGGTESTRNHTFKGFSQRIAQLKIEPVRRGRSTILDDAELESTFSYFRDAFLEWRELNLSEGFSTFARRVASLCDSLPQVLHHSDRIVELLVEYIEKGDKFSEEPLLSLLAHLAHDLGERFEKHFQQAVTVVSRLAATHADVEVIEWSFACLAWLFKYLSRLLVPDLRPVFDLISPLLGKERQKAFVSRFAAESLSFLIRKAGAGYHRDKTPLRLILSHISKQVEHLQGSAKDYDFQNGLMYLLADSLKGVQRGFHSSAPAILQELLAETYHDEHARLRTPPLEPILVGILTAIIHHTDAENFTPLLHVLIAQIESVISNPDHTALSSRLLFVACSVRQGTRISDWKPVLRCTQLLVESSNDSELDTDTIWDILSVVSVVFQYCSLDAAIPHEKLLEGLTQEPWEKYFLPFCNLFAHLGPERFKTLLLPYFKRFIVQKAHDYGPELCAILPQLSQTSTISSAALIPSERWQTQLPRPFEELRKTGRSDSQSNHLAYYCNALLDTTLVLRVDQEQTAMLQADLEELLKRAVKIEKTELLSPVDLFALGAGFHFFVEHSTDTNVVVELWPSLCEVSSICGHSVSFWRALLALVKRQKGDLSLEGSHVDSLKRALMQCLGSPSHELRLTALSILETFVETDESLRHIISVAVLIEQTPLTLEHQRSIAMRIGQLAKLYPAISSNEWICEAIPMFCFGLLQVRLASVWDDACLALKAMCDTKEGEGHVTRIAFDWLKASETDNIEPGTTPDGNAPARRYVTEFECTNVADIQELITETQSLSGNVQDQLETMFQKKHAKIPFLNSSSRTQSLRVLNSLPHIAEKRSRILVPILLHWALNQHEATPESDDITEDTQIDTEHRWARKDQKAILSLFSKFTNPKVLYRSDEVQAALLTLLGNGDLDIQKAALQALLTWKDPAISPYKEDLLNLLDDARFRDELPVFLSEGEIQDSDLKRILPIVLRLLYGKVIAGKRGLESKRKAVFVGLKTRFGDNAIHQFLGIAFGSLDGITILENGTINESLLQKDVMDTRKQVGMLNMLDDLISTFQTSFNPFTATVVDPVLYCLIRASRDLSPSMVARESEEEAGEARTMKVSLLKTIRQRSLHILARLTESCPEYNWHPYSAAIVKELIEPRLENLPIETAQSISGLLRLFAAWSKSPLTAPFLVEHNQMILNKVVDCLQVPSAKDEVKKFVLDDILGNIMLLVANDVETLTTEDRILTNRIHTDIIQPYSNVILNEVGNLLRKSPSKEVLESGVQTVAALATHVVGSTESRSMIEIATFLLRQPSKRVNPRTKLALLKILHEFIQRYDDDGISELFDSIFDAICPMFAFVQDRAARSLLSDITQDLSQVRDDLKTTAGLCHDLNSFAKSRLDEPDFDRRSRAFNEINDKGYLSYSLVQWKPLIYNMLYSIKDNDELSIRTNAALSLRRFIEVSETDEFTNFISTAILPGIQNGMRETSELVRAEFLAVLEQLVQQHNEWAPVADLHILLSEDQEASFFSNVLHIQGHRRLRALRRLAANAAHIKSGNIYHILLPLLEHFVFNKANDESADSLSGETIKTLAALVEWLEWPQLRSLLKRYIGYLTSKEDMQKPIIKLIVGLMDGLNRAGRAKGYIITASATVQANADADAVETNSDTEAMDVDKPISSLTKTLPQQEKLTSDLTNHFLPDLTEYLHKKDDATVSLRVPVAIAITKVLLVLPPHEIEARLPGVLLDICYILKSRAQESRDMSRNTLTDIATVMGPGYLGFILKALRTALQRGYQLHVLSFSMHHILVKLSDQLKPGDLDYCLSDIVDVIMDDTFGITGQEKDAEEYISKMKEVKSSKSFDSMDIVARSATPAHLIKLVVPIRSLLLEKLNARMVQKIDELLRRIGLGVLQNPTVNNRDILVFCFELIQEVYKASATNETKGKIDPKNKRYLINMRGAAKSGARLSTSSYVYKLTRFSLDILRTVLRKHTELQTPQNLAGFLPVIGDAMVQGQEEVQVSAVRLLTTFIKVPMSELDTNCPVYVDEAVRAIKGAPTSNTELAQASLKLVSAVLRDRPNVDIKDRDIGHLIKRMIPDLDEPDRQGVSFGYLKAVMNRRFDIPEIYEAMDKVAQMMITNQTKSARDVARSHYFQFLTSYTQSEKRFKKQMEFLLKNLRYEHVEGRQSVMDALDLIITKALPRFTEQTQYEYHGMMFLPLINVVANDDSSKCREIASLLVKRLFQHCSDKRLQSFTTDLKSWLEQDENAGLKRLGIQCWGFYFEAMDEEDGEPKVLSNVLNCLDSIIDECLARRSEDDWELLYYSLTLLSKVCKKYPDTMFTSSKESLWTAVQASTSYPHAWVKLKAAELMGTQFAHFATTNKDNGLVMLPLEGPGGLQLAEQNMIQLANAFLKNLLNAEVTEQLCTQSVKNIAFLARCFAVNGAKWHWQKADGEDEDEEVVIDEKRNSNGDPVHSDDEFGGFSPPPETTPKKANTNPPTAIHRLMIRLSGLVRRDNRSMLVKISTIHLLETVFTKLPLEPLASSLPHVLTTLNTLIDPATTIPRAHTNPMSLNEPNEQYKSLIDKAREIMQTLQKRMGTQEYLKVMSEVQKLVRERREERRRKRKVEAVVDPERAEKEKRRRHDVKRVKRKEKGLESRGMRRGW